MACCETLVSFVRKFFSLLMAIIIAAATVIYVVGAGVVITKDKSMGNSGFAHFLGVLSAIITAIGYVALHFVPRKAYRLLYALTILFLLSLFLVSHSLGLAAIAVTKCNSDGEYGEGTGMLNPEGILASACTGNGVIFAGAFLNVILYIIALFDVQAVLLSRVKSKTYGERFVEMGISN